MKDEGLGKWSGMRQGRKAAASSVIHAQVGEFEGQD